MSTHSIDESTAPTPQQSVEVKGSAIHGVLIGLIPLGLLAGVDYLDRWIGSGHRGVCNCLLACVAASGPLAKSWSSSASSCDLMDTWLYRAGHHITHPAGLTITPAPCSIKSNTRQQGNKSKCRLHFDLLPCFRNESSLTPL